MNIKLKYKLKEQGVFDICKDILEELNNNKTPAHLEGDTRIRFYTEMILDMENELNCNVVDLLEWSARLYGFYDSALFAGANVCIDSDRIDVLIVDLHEVCQTIAREEIKHLYSSTYQEPVAFDE